MLLKVFLNMVAPKNMSKNPKQQIGDVKSKSPSPEPFREPDGMTTIDLNKSDDYARESELETAELKKRQQIKYLAQLLFALGSILVIVLLIIMMAFLNNEYHLFTVIPLKLNKSYQSTIKVHNTATDEEFLNITRILKQETFRQHLEAGNYAQQFPLEMDLCKLFKSTDFCCDVFRNSELKEMLEFCTVNDMLHFLTEYEMESIENQKMSDHYPSNGWQEANINNLKYDIDEESGKSTRDNIRSRRQLKYESRYEPQLHSYLPLDPLEREVHQQEYIDPYNDFNQYQPSEINQQPYQYQSPEINQPLYQYKPPDQYQAEEHQKHSPEYKNQYLQAPYVPNQETIKLLRIHPEHEQQSEVLPQTVQKKYQFPENIIAEIERSNHESSLKNLQNNPISPGAQAIEQFESYGMNHKLGDDMNKPYSNQNLKPWLSLDKNDMNSMPNNENWNRGPQRSFTNSNSEANKMAPGLEIPDDTKSEPKLQSALMPLPNRVLENIYRHVTVAPKIQHAYKSSEFPSGDQLVEFHPPNSDFAETRSYDSGRISNNDRRLNIDPRLKVDANGKFYIDDNQDSLNNKQKENIDGNRVFEIHHSKSIPRTNTQDTTSIGPSRLHIETEEKKIIPQSTPEILGSLLDFNGTTNPQINILQNLMEHNEGFGPNFEHTAITEKPVSNSDTIFEHTNNLEEIHSATTENLALTYSSKSVNDTEKISTTELVTETPSKSKTEQGNLYIVPSADQEISQKNLLRSNTGQDLFISKQKENSFTTSEDTQSSQQSYLNPCYNPYMSSYIPFMPSAIPSVKVGSTQESGYLKVIPVSPPQVQNQQMYVLNPSMFYGIPTTSQSTYPSLTQNPFLPQGLYPQVAQPPYGGGYNSPVQVTSSGGQYYMCNPIPTPTNNIAGLAGVEVRRSASNLQNLMEGIEYFGRNNKSREADTLICPMGEQACLDNIKCIKNHHVCDSEVHCDDSSDELGCTCKDRVGKLRLCDGYCDCPTCEDEQECFGCEEDEYSCDDWSRFRRSTCVPISQRCDGIKQCEITGKDEMDCSILADHIGNFPLNKVSNAVGYLHRNYNGKWYPTCFGTQLWAAEVCQVEAGPSAIIPKAHMTLTTDPYNGLFINILPNNKVSLVNTCVQDRAAFVECPPIYCGLRFLVNNPYRTQEVDTSIEDMLNDLERAYKSREDAMVGSNIESFNKSNLDDHTEQHRDTRSPDLRSKDQIKLAHLEEVIENLERTFKRREISELDKPSDILQQSRVVGGKPSQPAAWPWLISIYKNGIFHCGGVLINELWIITASHCVDRYWQYYYEIQAGALRRFSYSPMDQRRWAKVVVPHELYSKTNLRNDIALMKLSAPVRYNKYVRPICLPSEATAGQDFLKGPIPGSICTTVGWGATVEHGADPDHLREVEVPILEHCKHKEDSDVYEICAGLTDGGKDACQGDSGGPLMCRNPNNPNQWYLAGIVSHGEGCARPNEPGVYTKVSRYMAWIAENTRDDKVTLTTPIQKCSGYICKGTKRCVPKKRRCDRIVDCLLGDDEMNCEDNFRQLFKHSRKSMSTEPAGNFISDDLSNLESMDQFNIVGSKLNYNIEDKDGEISTHEKNAIEDQKKTQFQEIYFKCQILLQVVPINKRCNRIIDCEDGTDEFNCTCADYVENVDPSAICDGVSDCTDLSDEQNCVTCNTTEYTCRLAQKCIDASKRCDGISDCPRNEDELNCASLTNGHNLTLDSDDRPMFKSRGIVTINHLGQWKPLCLNTSSLIHNDEPSIATAICNVLGFHDYLSYHKYLVENRTINATYSLRNGRILSEIENKKCENCCEGLYISCSNTSTSSTLQFKSLEQVKELYFAPWIAGIYSNGRYKCMGTLLNQYWVVTSAKCFIGITMLQGNYLVAVFGRGKLHFPVKGPHEQVIRIVESITVNETDIVLLRLEHDVKFNRYVQAANLNLRKDGLQIEKCYAVGQDNDNSVKFVPLSPIKNCLVGFRCFEKKIEEPCNNIHSWSGTIICDSRSGWYPAAVFNEDAGHCELNHQKKYTSVKFYKNEISKIMAQTADPIPSPPCDGLQCNLGNCVPREKVCDGVSDCHSGEDEISDLCYEKEKNCYTADNCVCPQTHLKCLTTHKCFPKSSFCDRVDNCGDFEDEPDMCTCRNYLKLTDPEKICDGVLHCLDRSDEDSNICTCRLDDFHCGKTNKCIPQDMVCDGVKDCPNGEDEAICLSLNTKNHDRSNAGEVMTRTAGVWHAGCFDLNYSTLQLEEICYKLGFSGGSANQLTPPSNITTLTTLRPVLDTFDVVWLRRQPGNKLMLRIRSGHEPYVKFIPEKGCHRLFIACI